jgi:hypothetical protein
MNYEQDNPFPTLLRDGLRDVRRWPGGDLTKEDQAIFDSQRQDFISRRFARHFDTAQDEKITAALARASAEGVIPKMQPLMVFLDSLDAPREDTSRKWPRSMLFYSTPKV